MKIVFDESVPRPLAAELRKHGLDVSTFPNAWKGLANGRLLRRVGDGGFGCLLTCDKNMPHQQNLPQAGILIALLPTRRQQLLLEHAEEIARALKAVDVTTGLVRIAVGLSGSRS